MELEPVVTRSASQGAFEQLIERLLSGGLDPGLPLPAERSLTEILGVNRQAVREALQRLAQAGLVQINQGEPTRALDYRRSGGLDLLPRLLVGPDGPDPAVARAVMEMRACIGPDAARRAAERATPELAGKIAETVRQMAGSDLDVTGLAQLDLTFWDLVVEASDNIAYRLAFNSLRAAYEPLADILGPVLTAELTDVEAHGELAEAIGSGDAERAARIASALLAKGTHAIAELISNIEGRGEVR